MADSSNYVNKINSLDPNTIVTTALWRCHEALRGLVDVINEDDEGDFFICREAAEVIAEAKSALKQVQDVETALECLQALVISAPGA